MKKILFVRSNPPYNDGDVAFFTDEIAKRLVNGGKARYVVVKKAKNEEEVEAPEAKNLDSPPRDKMVHSAKIKK
jgi:hypothetical protein